MEELIELQHYSGYFLDISGIGDYHFALFTLGFGFRLLGSRLSILFKRKRLGAAFRIFLFERLFERKSHGQSSFIAISASDFIVVLYVRSSTPFVRSVP